MDKIKIRKQVAPVEKVDFVKKNRELLKNIKNSTKNNKS